MGASRYRDLEAYKQATAIADDLRRAALEWSSFDAWTIGVQLVRAADSIGANIAEAYGRYGLPDQRRLLHVARGSAYETEHWIARALDRSLLHDTAFDDRITQLIRTLNGLIRFHRQQ